MFLSVSVLLIILGVFIAIIGIVGTVGAIFASSVFGRILLGLVSEQNLHVIVCTLVAYCYPDIFSLVPWPGYEAKVY